MSDHPDIRHKVLHSLKWVGLAKVTTQIIRWLLTFWVIRLLTPEDYGLLAMSDVFFGFMQLLIAGLFVPGLIWAKDLSKEDLQRFFGAILVSYAAMFLVQYSLADSIASYFNAERVADILKVNAWCFLILAFSVIPSALLARDMEFKSISIVTAISNIGAAFVTLAVALKGYGVWALVVGEIFAIASMTIMTVLIKPVFMLPRFDFSGIGSYLKFGGLLTIYGILAFVFLHLDVAIAGRYMSAAEIGLFTLGLQFALMPQKKILPLLKQVAFPAFSRIQGEHGLIRYYVLKAQRLSLVVTIPIFWGLASVVDLVIPIILGEKWIAAIVPTTIILLIMPLRFSDELFNPALKSMGKAWHMMINISIAISFLIVALYVMLDQGAVGISLAWAMGYPGAFLIISYRNCLALNIPPISFYGLFTVPVISGGVMFLVVFAMKHVLVEVSVVSMLSRVFVGAFIFICAIYFLKPSLIDEFKSLVLKTSKRV